MYSLEVTIEGVSDADLTTIQRISGALGVRSQRRRRRLSRRRRRMVFENGLSVLNAIPGGPNLNLPSCQVVRCKHGISRSRTCKLATKGPNACHGHSAGREKEIKFSSSPLLGVLGWLYNALSLVPALFGLTVALFGHTAKTHPPESLCVLIGLLPEPKTHPLVSIARRQKRSQRSRRQHGIHRGRGRGVERGRG